MRVFWCGAVHHCSSKKVATPSFSLLFAIKERSCFVFAAASVVRKEMKISVNTEKKSERSQEYGPPLKSTGQSNWGTDLLKWLKCGISKSVPTLLSGFINALYKGKLEASGFPDGVTTTEEKLQYIAEIHNHEGIDLDLDKDC